MRLVLLRQGPMGRSNYWLTCENVSTAVYLADF